MSQFGSPYLKQNMQLVRQQHAAAYHQWSNVAFKNRCLLQDNIQIMDSHPELDALKQEAEEDFATIAAVVAAFDVKANDSLVELMNKRDKLLAGVNKAQSLNGRIHEVVMDMLFQLAI